jgi:sugar phosphate isomerase/epimerase
MSLPLAVQLHTFRDPARFGGAGHGLDPATLRGIAEAGFLGVETVGVPGDDVAEARSVLDDLGLEITSSHAWVDPADYEALAATAAALAELGSPRMILSGRPPTDDLDALTALGDRLTAAAAIADAHGMRLGYHNHDIEMRTLDGVSIIDRLVEQLGDTMDVQIDIFWAVVGGADPASVIAGLGERVVSLHLKDGVALPASDRAEEPFVNVPVGEGVVDPAPSIAAAEAAGSVEWLIVEFDHVADSPLEATRRSLANLVERGLGRARPR